MSAHPAWPVLLPGSLAERSTVAGDGMPSETLPVAARATEIFVAPLDPARIATATTPSTSPLRRPYIAKFSFDWSPTRAFGRGARQREQWERGQTHGHHRRLAES